MKMLQIIRAAAPIFLASLVLGDVSAQARSAHVEINGDGNTVIIQQGSDRRSQDHPAWPHVDLAYRCETPLGIAVLLTPLPRGSSCYGVFFGGLWHTGVVR